MKKFLVKLLNVIIIIIIAPVLIIGFIPFAIFRGFTDEFTMDEYFNIWGSFLNMLAYPVTKYEERKEHYEELKRKIKYYREECGRLNNIIDELEKEKREEEK